MMSDDNIRMYALNAALQYAGHAAPTFPDLLAMARDIEVYVSTGAVPTDAMVSGDAK